MENPTSIKQLIQGMQVKDMELHEGVVVSADPLQIKLVNNEKMVLDKDILIVPMHLTDYETVFDIYNIIPPDLSSKTNVASSHSHILESFQIKNAKIKVYNHLKKDEKVMLLSYNNGKIYYILDRVVK